MSWTVDNPGPPTSERMCDYAYFDADQDGMVVCILVWDHAGDHVLERTPVTCCT